MSDKPEHRKRRPKGEGLLDIEALAERWGMEVEELKRFVRSESIPFILFGKPDAEKIRWDRVIFRLEAIQKWEASNQHVYSEHRKGITPEARPSERSPLRGGYRP
jgi:hypothetical protein